MPRNPGLDDYNPFRIAGKIVGTIHPAWPLRVNAGLEDGQPDRLAGGFHPNGMNIIQPKVARHALPWENINSIQKTICPPGRAGAKPGLVLSGGLA